LAVGQAEAEDRARAALEAAIHIEHQAGRFSAAATRALEGYGPEILGFLVATTPSEPEAAEVFSQFCLELWTALPNFEWRSSFRTWVYTLARHAAERRRRDPYSRRSVSLDAHPELAAVETRVRTETHPFRRTDVKDQGRVLRESLAVEDQELLILRVDKGLSWDDVATILLATEPAGPAEVARKASALRKRFERVTIELRELARAAGLLDQE
jgi:RNA polymerase sigma-70 factor (ECF subfamily)